MNETQIIQRYFRDLGARRADVVLGVGDDAALLAPPAGAELVLTTDALVEGRHFLSGAPAHSLGHRALAVNLSDIAAMGATPAWMLLSLILPQTDPGWLDGFSRGLGALAEIHQVALIGGNLSGGPLSVTVTLIGWVPRGQALRRDGARPGDVLWVSGTLGDAAVARQLLQREGGAHPPTPAATAAMVAALQPRFEYPQPRVQLGQALRGLASACIDVSDGLYQDVQRLAQASGCAADIEVERLPFSESLQQLPSQQAVLAALTGGEDYELCFCTPSQHVAAIEERARALGEQVTRIGTLQNGSGVNLHSSNPDSVKQVSTRLFDHFAAPS